MCRLLELSWPHRLHHMTCRELRHLSTNAWTSAGSTAQTNRTEEAVVSNAREAQLRAPVAARLSAVDRHLSMIQKAGAGGIRADAASELVARSAGVDGRVVELVRNQEAVSGRYRDIAKVSESLVGRLTKQHRASSAPMSRLALVGRRLSAIKNVEVAVGVRAEAVANRVAARGLGVQGHVAELLCNHKVMTGHYRDIAKVSESLVGRLGKKHWEASAAVSRLGMVDRHQSAIEKVGVTDGVRAAAVIAGHYRNAAKRSDGVVGRFGTKHRGVSVAVARLGMVDRHLSWLEKVDLAGGVRVAAVNELVADALGVHSRVTDLVRDHESIIGRHHDILEVSTTQDSDSDPAAHEVTTTNASSSGEGEVEAFGWWVFAIVTLVLLSSLLAELERLDVDSADINRVELSLTVGGIIAAGLRARRAAVAGVRRLLGN